MPEAKQKDKSGAMDLIGKSIIDRAKALFSELAQQSEESKIDTINELRKILHQHSSFASEPVDCVLWVKAEMIQANDYNPNSVAPPEMKLLEHSILEDGYTQPIVSWDNDGHIEVVDGFHRNRVGRECATVRKRVKGYLPVTIINSEREDRGDRIAATIRHNRARGKHQVEAMSDIVVELKRRNWSDDKIGRELGMDPDEVLRLCQISGLAEMFADRDFSEAWEHTGPAEAEEMPDEIDGQKVELEWMKGFMKPPQEPGWQDRTEQNSILYGINGQHLAAIQKSHIASEWFLYVYLKPIQEGRAPSRDEAKMAVSGILAAHGQLHSA